MPQSYKTIKRAALSERFAKLLFLICITVFFFTSAQAIQTVGGKRGAQFFTHYAYRLQVPKNQVEAIGKFLQEKYGTLLRPETPVEKEVLSEFYFDDEKWSLRRQNIVLRHRIHLTSENRKERIQLILPPVKSAGTGKEIAFRLNRKPDKGAGFTAHPLLKLLRNKDRPVLDSLLKPYHIQASGLKPVLEITQHREQFHLQKQNSDWLVLTLTKMQTSRSEHEYWEIQITPERKLLTHAAPDVKKQLLKEVDQLSGTLKRQFPALKPQIQTEYTALLQLNPDSKSAKKKKSLPLWFILVLALITGFIIYTYRKRKPA